MSKHVVATVAEIPPGQRKLVTVRGRSIAVFNLDGEFFGLFNRCPHQGGPMCEGILTGLIESGRAGALPVFAQGRDPALPVARLGVRRAHRAVVLRAGADPGAPLSRGGRRRAARGAGTLRRRNRAGDDRGTLRRGGRLTACPVCKPGDPAPHPAHEPARTAHPACGPAVVRGSCRGAATLRSEPAGPGRPGAHRGVPGQPADAEGAFPPGRAERGDQPGHRLAGPAGPHAVPVRPAEPAAAGGRPRAGGVPRQGAEPDQQYPAVGRPRSGSCWRIMCSCRAT